MKRVLVNVTLMASALIVLAASGGMVDRVLADDAAKSTLHTNTLGRTGYKVADIGFGAGGTTDPAVIQYALDMGINYFDTAESYGEGASETAIGQVAKDNREKMVICTKLAMNGETKEIEIKGRLDECLKRLQTTYVDILMIHSGNKDAVDNPEVWKAFESLKKEGKIKFTGMSCHGPNLTEAFRPVIAGNKVDVILSSWDPTAYPDLPELLVEAKKKGIGLVGMKVFTSARKADLSGYKSKKLPFHLAALKWALTESHMDTLIPSINVMDQIDEYVTVSGTGAKGK